MGKIELIERVALLEDAFARDILSVGIVGRELVHLAGLEGSVEGDGPGEVGLLEDVVVHVKLESVVVDRSHVDGDGGIAIGHGHILEVEQVARRTIVEVKGSVETAAEEGIVHTEVEGIGLLPLQVGIALIHQHAVGEHAVGSREAILVGIGVEGVVGG